MEIFQAATSKDEYVNGYEEVKWTYEIVEEE